MTKRFLSLILYITFSTLTLVLPAHEASATPTVWVAPASGETTGWAGFASKSTSWIHMKNIKGYGENVAYPRDNWAQIGSAVWDQANSQFNWKMIEGEKWVTSGREELGEAGADSTQISANTAAFPKTASYVFASYSPGTAKGIIEIQKVEKTPTGNLVVYRADYTPWHGELYKWRRDYLTPAEAASPSKLGYNPFEHFKGGSVTDNVFHNISWEGFGVAVGLAMRYSKAHVAYVAADKTRFTQEVKKSGGMLKKTVKTYIKGYVKPQWFVATLANMQPEGGMSSICVRDVGGVSANGNTSTCDAPEHVASSNVSMVEWAGGNMPATEQKAYDYYQKKSSFTVLAFTILTFAVTWGIASVASMAIGGSVASGALSGALASPLTTGIIGAGLYAGVNVLGGASLTTAQAGWAGETGNGVVNIDTGSLDKHQQRLNTAVDNLQVNSRFGTGMTSTKELYSGNCNESWTTAQCLASHLDPGTMHRADGYAESNTVLQLRDRETKCKLSGLTGFALKACASPKEGVWTVNTGM